jgi:endonuclease/exonuclease/phosphatase family metal-dependent hydrolase
MRTICYNIYMCRGWPQQEEVSKEIREIVTPELYASALGKYKPDVITFSEVPSDFIVQAIAKSLGMQAICFESPELCHGALLTRFEVLESRNCPLQCGERPEDLFTRHWGRAVLRTSSEELIVHSAHLFPDAQSSMHAMEVE